MRDRDRFIRPRKGRYYYYRRVPKRVSKFDERGTIRIALGTDNIALARKQRDALEQADDLYWSSLLSGDKTAALERYKAATERALLKGFTYAPAEHIASEASLSEIVGRIEALSSPKDVLETEALLGGLEKPKVLISDAHELYINEIAASELASKSEPQKKAWKKVKLRAVSNFIALIGDLPMEDVTREHAREFYKWWLERIVPPEGSNAKPLTANSGNRDIGNIRKLFTEYFKHIGLEDRPNPFRNMSFTDTPATERKAFSNEWIISKILDPYSLTSLNWEARFIVYTLIETGARPSEICNLTEEQIHLDAPVPHIAIAPTGRQIKTASSKREIPLVGVSLEAISHAPKGFPRYKDKEVGLSQTLNKAFRKASLFPTPDHYIYSFRHSFEERMQEAGLDYGLRCLLMGHKTDRPAYGDGGSMEFRRKELEKIVLPYNQELFKDAPMIS